MPTTTTKGAIPLSQPLLTLVRLGPRPRRASARGGGERSRQAPPAHREAGTHRRSKAPAPASRDSVRILGHHKPTDSVLERAFLGLLRNAGLRGPDTSTPLCLRRVDCLLARPGPRCRNRRRRLPPHPRQQVRDRRRDQAHARAGRTSIRFADVQLDEEPQQVIAARTTVIARRSANSAPWRTLQQQQPFANYQYEIYLAGHGRPGARAARSRTPSWRRRRREKLAAGPYGYVAGGAGTEDTDARQPRGVRRWRIVPRMLRDVAERDLTTDDPRHARCRRRLLAPVGVQSIVHPDGELATARAAAASGVPLHRSAPPRRTRWRRSPRRPATAPRWYQLYWPRDASSPRASCSRAEDGGLQRRSS